jgi:hypothetical protein
MDEIYPQQVACVNAEIPWLVSALVLCKIIKMWQRATSAVSTFFIVSGTFLCSEIQYEIAPTDAIKEDSNWSWTMSKQATLV